MSLGKQMVEALARLANDGPAAVNALAWTDGERRIAVDGPVASARLDLADSDRYSVALRSLEVELAAGEVPVDTRTYLSDHAADLIRRLSYLEEPLAVWELDGAEALAQLRSSPPQREGEEIAYWEVVVRAGERPSASIARYRWIPGLPEREPVIYPATFALVGRLTDSLVAALAE
jgi:hypothetical protein